MNLTSGSIWLAAKLNAHATPNHRTSHEGAVPRLGGIGPVCAIILLFIVTWSAFPTLQRLIGISPVDVIPWQQGVLFLALGIGGFTLGLLDDLGRLPTLGKLLGQFVLACLPAGLGVVIHEVEWPYFGTVELPYFLGALLSGLWVVLIMNVYNFMDGINGLAGRALETFGYGLLLMTLNLSFRYQFSILACIMLGAALGFLRHNIAVPTRTFLGDCGSQGLGAMMAAAALMVHNNDNGLGFHDPFLPFVILLFPLIFDVCLTLIRRSLKGKNLLQPHREHLYQRYLVCIGEKHDRCLSFVSNFLYTSAILAPIYFRFYPGNGPLRLILIGIAVGMMIFQWHRVLRLEEQRPSALVK
ncbi:MAG: MraY family glycosyltransferase [Sumerlaeia bacterium]